MSFGVGQPVTRTEDPKFLTGRGSFLDDINLANQTHAVVVCSTRPHANIKSVDTSKAEAAPGVVLVLTGADAVADGLGGIPGLMPEDVGGPPGFRTLRPVLASDKVRHVGERIAFVVAETQDQARDAAELIHVDYEDLPSVIAAKDAVADGAPQLYEEAENNVSYAMRMGNADAVAEAFKAADHVTSVKIYNNRLTAVAMEPRGTLGDYNPAEDRYTLYTSTQNPHGIRMEVAHLILHLPETKLRVIARDVGGGFGMKGGLYPEDALVVWAAKKLGRPVKWVPTRTESMIMDDHSRDHTTECAIALARDGKILALRWQALNNMGPYIVNAASVSVMFALRMAQSAYAIPEIDVSTKAVLTNKVPVSPYRGAGRPEAINIIERLIDQAAREMGIDRIDIRRRNFIQPDAMPFATHTHWEYDSGEFETTMDKCLDMADWQGFDARKKATEAAGKIRGRGMSYYIEDNGIFNDRMELRFDPGGSVTIVAGTFSHGQGHETVYAQMISDWLGVPFEQIGFVQGDTDAVAFGRGTYASRSMVVGGSALRAAADDIIEKGKRWAGHLLEADAEDIEFADGMFTIAGTDKKIPITAVAEASFAPVGMPIELGVGLEGSGGADGIASFPNGCHICEVEIDPETGGVKIDRYFAVDDMGKVINPLLAHGQIMGGIVQGVGQALLEDIIFEPESGQLLSGSLLDYCVPRADDLPRLEVGMHEVLCKTNAIGVKGAGEGGTVAAVPAVFNAVLDALAPLGVTDVAMPATPAKVWAAINEAA